jgi:hypothetical protein
VFFADWRQAMKKRIKLHVTRLSIKTAQLLTNFTGIAMALISTKVERIYQIHMEKAQMRLAPRPSESCRPLIEP